MACDFISMLGKLRKQSIESVDNTDTFDIYKKYLHVNRSVEDELRELLREINQKQDKCLVLLCGSAGDGKSHLISYLKNADEELLLEGYELYNDATESSEPTKTSADTLMEKLRSFDDDHYLLSDGKKMVIAINLGTLNNFIESEQGKSYSKLKQYVHSNQILSGFGHETGYINHSVFQHVSFSDYQTFSIGISGIETNYLEQLFEKVFANSEQNPFFMEYEKSQGCPLCKRCPVRHNYEFMMNPAHQKAVIKRIVETVIMDKTMISTREVFNLIYDILIHPDFDQDRISVGTSELKYLTDYISWSTPMLLDEYKERSIVLDSIRNHDVLKVRAVANDEYATRFHSLGNIKDEFIKSTSDTPYIILENITDIAKLGGIKPELKKLIFRYIMRLNRIKGSTVIDKETKRFDQYVRFLYFQNCGKERQLGELYEITKRAIYSWDGKFGDNYICIDDSNDHFWILEELHIEPSINRNRKKVDGSIKRFFPSLKLRFKKEFQTDDPGKDVSIDFALFNLLCNMNEGYRPTVQDKNIHTDFVSFVQQMIAYGNKKTRVTILPKDSTNSKRMVFEENAFGYEFKVQR